MPNLLIVHTSPEELVVITPTVDGAPITTGYQVCILPIGVTPDKDNPAWQTPDMAGTDSGILVGPGTTVAKTFNAGDVAMPWAHITGYAPENIIKPMAPAVQFT